MLVAIILSVLLLILLIIFMLISYLEGDDKSAGTIVTIICVYLGVAIGIALFTRYKKPSPTPMIVEEEQPSEIIQIAGDGRLYALCKDNSVWQYNYFSEKWLKIKNKEVKELENVK